ncbi:hypothetical protein G9G63_09705 [Paenibacillus sp. EKM202P]|uniref:hypothetical protein n=1 Tax=unclassified Paenibacillus TaxID=185978 RepID=UPI0013EA0150|nr:MULTISPECIES: hypothetical protein [unclassified Paenibacillus]KAF6565422.1 hypothetical protein G9G63_09705 [Paenibacillus sp. EKM202P]KAF6569253.1 hypothetical protein G9G64_12390 [Paenibacillus sp. EKM207P]
MKEDFKKLALIIQESQIDDMFRFTLKNELGETIFMGVKIINEFDSDIAVISAVGGGYEMAVWINEDFNDCKYITDKLMKNFDGYSISI